MKKPLTIIILALLQAACAVNVASDDAHRDLLTFQQLAVEISVQHAALEPDVNLSGTTAMNTTAAN